METEKIASLSAGKPSAAEVLVFLAKLHYEIIRTVENDYLAVPLSGPKIAKNVKGGSSSLGDDLMRRYREHCGKIPSERAVNDAIRVIMSHIVYTCTTDSTFSELMMVMTENRVRHLPVTDEEGKLISIISIGDVVKNYINELDFERVALEHYVIGGI